MKAIEVRLLGPPLVRLGKELLSLGPKAAALVAYLAVEGAASRERVLGQLWPDSPQKKAQGSLRYLLHSIKKSVSDLIESDAQTLALAGAARVDVLELSQAVTPAQRSAAAELFRGHFCEGLQGGSPEFDDWLEKQRERWGQEVIANLLKLARLLNPREGLKPARQALLIDPANEGAHATVIELLMKQGEAAEAHRQFERCREALWDELGVEPGESTRELLALVAESDFCANLPAATSSVLGRESAKKKLSDELLRHRLITLTGEGGIGKTTLALGAARAFVGEKNVWLVELARLADRDSVERETVSACSVPEGTALAQHLGSASTLLVLDNCEHLLEQTSRLVERLLRECPELTVLATSREPLRVGGEHVFPLDPLAVPLEADSDLDASPAVQLFLERARQAGTPESGLSDLTSIGVLCRRLDGLPLAIELAAARARSTEINQLLAGLEQRFRLLKNKSPGAEPRQSTLAALIDWSYERLDRQDSEGFRKLSVFSGGFYAESAADFLDLDCWDTADLLDRLVEKSLLRTRPEGAGRRYYFLESLREFGVARNQDCGELEDLRKLHLDYFLQMAASLYPLTKGQKQRVFLDKLDSELVNFRAALQYANKRHAPEGLNLAAALCPLWKDRDHRDEGLEFLKCFLDQTGESDAQWPRGLLLKGEIEIQLARCEEALVSLGEAFKLGRERAQKEVVARAAKGLGTGHFFLKQFELSLDFFRLAKTEYEGLSDLFEVANCINNLGLAELYLGNLGDAESSFRDSLELHRREGSLKGEGVALGNLAGVAHRREEPEIARFLYLEALEKLNGVGALWNCAYFLEGLGGALASLKSYREAVESLAVADNLRLKLRTPRLPAEAEQYELLAENLRKEFPAFEEAWDRGSQADATEFLDSLIAEKDSKVPEQNIRP